MGVISKVKGLFVETIYGSSGKDSSPYLTRISLPGLRRARIHIFHRGDSDPDPHDHPWDFWTFPLVPYWEQVFDPATNKMSWQTVQAFKVHFRKAEHAHRIISGMSRDLKLLRRRKVVTIVFTGKYRRRWGFIVNAPTKPRWVYWQEYLQSANQKEAA